MEDICNICHELYSSDPNKKRETKGCFVCKNKNYHQECLEGWSKIHNSCPICRKELFLSNTYFEYLVCRFLSSFQKNDQAIRIYGFSSLIEFIILLLYYIFGGFFLSYCFLGILIFRFYKHFIVFCLFIYFLV